MCELVTVRLIQREMMGGGEKYESFTKLNVCD